MHMRSSSVPRNDFFSNDYQSPSYLEGQNLSNSRLGHNRGVSKDFGFSNITANAGKEILRGNINTEITAPSRPESKSIDTNDMLAYQNLNQTASDSKLHAPGSWKDYISQQTQLANNISLNEKQEQKLRALKYKETLDLMMQDEKRKKMDARQEFLRPSKNDDANYYALLQLEKMKSEEEKRKYNATLEYQKKEREDIRLRDNYQKMQEARDNQLKISKLREIEQQQAELEKEAKKHRFVEYKQMVDQRHQGQIAQQRARLEEKQGQYFLNDNERDQLFEKIRSKGFPNMAQFNHLQEIERERKMKYDEFISKQIQQRDGREVAENARKEEILKKLKFDALTTNQQQIADKALISQRKKEEENEQRKIYQENKKFLENIETYEKEMMVKQRKDYLEALKTQADARQQSRYNANELTSVEKAMNFRTQNLYASTPQGDSTMTSLPFVGKSYERTKQLRYLDNWLNHLPK